MERRDQRQDQQDVGELNDQAAREAGVALGQRSVPGQQQHDHLVGHDHTRGEDEPEHGEAPIKGEGRLEDLEDAARAFDLDLGPPVHGGQDIG